MCGFFSYSSSLFIFSSFECLLKEPDKPKKPETVPQPELTTKHEELLPQKTAITPLKGNCQKETVVKYTFGV